MAFYNFYSQNVAIKIVYYGPGLSGKTTNLRYICTKLDPASRSDLVCLETKTNRTFFFDLLPVSAGVIGDFKVHFQLMTVPGQVFYEASRKSVLKGSDGIVFVADSQAPLLDANLESFDSLRRNLQELEVDMNVLPMVFQYNKRDLEDLVPVETFNSLFNPRNLPYFEASAINGRGVFETLRAIASLTIPPVKEKIMKELYAAEEKKSEAEAQSLKAEEEEKKEEREREASLAGHSSPSPGTQLSPEERIDRALEEQAPSVLSRPEKKDLDNFTKIKLKSEKDIERELERLSQEFMIKKRR